MLNEALKAPEQILAARRQALKAATHRFFAQQYDVKALVFFGSILLAENPRDTDLVVIARPQFISTREEIDTMLMPLLLEAAENGKVYLPHPDTWSLEKIRRVSDSVSFGTFDRDYGNFVVGRKLTYFEPPSDRTSIEITRY